ncbi:hypothetical protein DFH09DRAFT_1068594 [Mycena vulgaris]|nr:hypothetical protein DFH09DRAFT_1068594 [Mycena vulgaris]
MAIFRDGTHLGPKKSLLQLFNGLNERTNDQTENDLIRQRQSSRRHHVANLESLFLTVIELLSKCAGPFENEKYRPRIQKAPVGSYERDIADGDYMHTNPYAGRQWEGAVRCSRLEEALTLGTRGVSPINEWQARRRGRGGRERAEGGVMADMGHKRGAQTTRADDAGVDQVGTKMRAASTRWQLGWQNLPSSRTQRLRAQLIDAVKEINRHTGNTSNGKRRRHLGGTGTSLSPRLPSGLPISCRGIHRATCNDPNLLDPMEKVNASKVLGLLQKAVASSAITSAPAPASSALPPRLACLPRPRLPRPPTSSGPRARASRLPSRLLQPRPRPPRPRPCSSRPRPAYYWGRLSTAQQQNLSWGCHNSSFAGDKFS